ncbi:hypothetical protein M885DRAFT_509505 [Pelagophyceae sp. CCMP2097]|nr:hypothetical protein M885DRAFT_509505 [Pelagophyceae sp. CCMP2097]
MSRAAHRESAAINLSLMALKDCFRAQHAAHFATGRAPRMPFRASPLTRVLRRCFEGADPGAVAILATLSAETDDLIHSVHTLRHVTLMAPDLAQRATSAATERLVPFGASAPGARLPVEAWTADDVKAWLVTADAGKFAHVVLPPGATGRDLLATSASHLGDLFARTTRTARRSHEGDMWVVGADANAKSIGRELYAALRREAAKTREFASGR